MRFDSTIGNQGKAVKSISMSELISKLSDQNEERLPFCQQDDVYAIYCKVDGKKRRIWIQGEFSRFEKNKRSESLESYLHCRLKYLTKLFLIEVTEYNIPVSGIPEITLTEQEYILHK